MLSFIKSFSSHIQSKYSVGQRAFRVGPWKVYDGKVRSTGEQVSVFVLDKSELTQLVSSAGIKPKTPALNEIYDFANRGVNQLAKLRHPAIVKLVEPMESSSKSLMFVTERVVTSLDSLINIKNNESELGGDDLNELSIERGVALVCQGLEFLHEQLSLVHLNVCPTSILVSATGDWKLFGLEFVQDYSSTSENFFFPQLDPRLPNFLRPNVDYMAPELAIDKRLGPENDVWSLAAVLYATYTLKPPLDCRANPNNYKEEYERFARKLKTMPPLSSRLSLSVTQAMFERTPSSRMNLGTLLQTSYFNNSLVKALEFLDDFGTKASGEKVAFLKQLIKILPEFPKSVLQRKILKFALGELSGPTADAACTQHLASVVFAIAKDMSRLTFSEEVLPIFRTLKDNAQFHDAVVENMGTIVQNTTDKTFALDVLPIIEVILKSAENSVTQRGLLLEAPVFMDSLNISGIEQTLFPLVIELFSATPVKGVKLACIGTFTTMIQKGLSKPLIQDKLLPSLQQMKTRDPQVVLSVKALYDAIAVKAPSAMVVEQVIPHLMTLSLGKDLSVAQFQSIISAVRGLVDKYEKSQVELLKHNKEVTSFEPTDDLFDTPPPPEKEPKYTKRLSGQVQSQPAPAAPISATPVQTLQTQKPLPVATPVQALPKPPVSSQWSNFEKKSQAKTNQDLLSADFFAGETSQPQIRPQNSWAISQAPQGQWQTPMQPTNQWQSSSASSITGYSSPFTVDKLPAQNPSSFGRNTSATGFGFPSQGVLQPTKHQAQPSGQWQPLQPLQPHKHQSPNQSANQSDQFDSLI